MAADPRLFMIAQRVVAVFLGVRIYKPYEVFGQVSAME
jgi:hypothetical protein